MLYLPKRCCTKQCYACTMNTMNTVNTMNTMNTINTSNTSNTMNTIPSYYNPPLCIDVPASNSSLENQFVCRLNYGLQCYGCFIGDL